MPGQAISDQFFAKVLSVYIYPGDGAAVTVLINGLDLHLFSKDHLRCELLGLFAEGLAALFRTIDSI
jgi:hypothetical protein